MGNQVNVVSTLAHIVKTLDVPLNAELQDIMIHTLAPKYSVREIRQATENTFYVRSVEGTMREVAGVTKARYQLARIVHHRFPKPMDMEMWIDPVNGNKLSNFERRYWFRISEPYEKGFRQPLTGWGSDAKADDVWDTAINIAARFVHDSYLRDVDCLGKLRKLLADPRFDQGGVIPHESIVEIMRQSGFSQIQLTNGI